MNTIVKGIMNTRVKSTTKTIAKASPTTLANAGRMPSIRVLLRAAGVVAVSAACALSAPKIAHAQRSADTSFSVPRNAVIDITVRTGRLVVRGTDRTTAELRSDDESYTLRASAVGIAIGVNDDRGSSRSRSRNGSQNNNQNRSRYSDESRLELTVPRGVRLVIAAGSADVDVQDIAGDVEVHALSGDVTMRGIGGRSIVETMSGDLYLTEGGNDARVTTMSGNITLRGVKGDAEVHTTSGDVIMSMVRAVHIKAESVSGDISFDGEVTDNAQLQLQTHAGDVTVRIPESTRGVVDVSTFSGEFSSNRPLTTTGSDTPNRERRTRDAQRYEFGGGGNVRVSISTFNGDIRFDRGARRSPD